MKWTIEMTEEELQRKTIVEQALDKRITQKVGAEKLGMSERQFRRLIKQYRQNGSVGLVSGHRKRPSNNRLEETERQAITEMLSDPLYKDFRPTLLVEKLEEYKGIQVSRETVRQMMINSGIYKPKTKKVTAHPQRERREHRGELVQIDGSYHAWLEARGPKACLLVFVDDATSEILAAQFVDHESYFAYAKVCKYYFRAVGLPVAFYSDKFSVFRVNTKGAIHKDAITQFNRALDTLGIELICANSPQAKGRVERANQTLQDRLIKEMRLLNICSYSDANTFLPDFITTYNRKFAVCPRSSADSHKPLTKSIDLDNLFAIHDTRIISKDLQIQFDNVVYQIITTRPANHLAGREVLILQEESGSLTAILNHQILALNVVLKQKKKPVVVSTKSVDHQLAVPAVNHPWRSYGKKLNGEDVVVLPD